MIKSKLYELSARISQRKNLIKWHQKTQTDPDFRIEEAERVIRHIADSFWGSGLHIDILEEHRDKSTETCIHMNGYVNHYDQHGYLEGEIPFKIQVIATHRGPIIKIKGNGWTRKGRELFNLYHADYVYDALHHTLEETWEGKGIA